MGEAWLIFIGTREFHTEVSKSFVMPVFFMYFTSVFTLYSQNVNDIYEL